MGIFNNQLSNVVEWEEFRDDIIFWKWKNREIKKGSRLIIRPGQDAIFMYNGRIEGVFEDSGNFEIESSIIPFLSTLKGFKFGFNSGLRAEVLFINTKEFTIKWGTKNAINIPAPSLPGGLPIRAFGTFVMKVSDYINLIDKVAGAKDIFTVDDVQLRVISNLDQLLMKWIVKEGKDMFNLQANAYDIAKGIQSDLDMEMIKMGFTITGFSISSFNYPQEIQDKINKSASYSMVGDVDKYQKIGMIDAMTDGKGSGNNSMSEAMKSSMGLAAGFNMANQMMGNSNKSSGSSQNLINCKNCGSNMDKSAKFCPECGAKNMPAQSSGKQFCTECGKEVAVGAKFCPNCGSNMRG